MKITVYTRAYNAEKYISKCVESVLEQSFRDFEYFIVDNGSTDGTRKLLEDYAKKDGRIRLTRLEKNTRNVTFSYMREFKGELVTQLDADDWWGPGFLERMISFLEKEQLDIAITGTVNYFEHDGSSRILRKLDQPKIFTQEQFAQHYPYFWVFPSTNWGNVMKAELFRNAQLRSQELSQDKLTYGSDTIFMLGYISLCGRIGIDSSALYHYRIREDSVSNDYDTNRFPSNVVYYDCISGFLKKHNTFDAGKQEWLKRVHVNSIRMTAETLANSKLSDAAKISELRRIAEHPYTGYVLTSADPDTAQARKVLLSILFNAEELREDDLNAVIRILIPGCAPAVRPENIALINAKPELADALAADDPDAVLAVLLDMIRGNELTKKYDLCGMAKALSSDNILLRNISDNKFLRRFGDIYLTVRRKKLGDALEKMTAVLRGGDKTDETFLQLYLNIASVLEKPDEFLYGKLCSAKYHLQHGKYDECRADINDLSEMGVEDNEDILRIKNKLEKLGK